MLLWWRTAPEKLSRRQDSRLRRQLATKVPVGVSAITLWELALLTQSGRITPEMPLDPWLDSLENDLRLFFYPINGKIVADAVRLPKTFPRDPADRIITATARCEGIDLLTADDRIRESGLVSVV